MAYMLRLWHVSDGGQGGWRASLENVHTGERRGFASLADLLSFLEDDVCQVVPDQTAPSAGER
jgi:hypothetical protein